MAQSDHSYLIGADENGLGARLGPLTVSAVLARVDPGGARLLRRKLRQSLRADLDDSKVLVSCHDVSLGEAWARAILERTEPNRLLDSPDAILSALSLDDDAELTRPCPSSTRAQCWTRGQEAFEASEEQLTRTRGHVAELAERGVELLAVRSAVVCNGRLDSLKRAGINRFSADLHQMERLVLALRERAGHDVVATCGKVGGMNQYGRFFGPLSDRLHSSLVEGQAESAYSFPRLGTLRFVRDADASDPLVMLASLVGKYLRELLMRRIAHYYGGQLPRAEDEVFAIPSGYHDPVSNRFVEATARLRKKLSIVDSCFQRAKEPSPPAKGAPGARGKAGRPTKKAAQEGANRDQTELF